MFSIETRDFCRGLTVFFDTIEGMTVKISVNEEIKNCVSHTNKNANCNFHICK